MRTSARVRISGPLVGYAAGFAAELTEQGYTDLSMANQLRLMADLSRWLTRARLALDELTPGLVDRFLRKRRRTHTQFVSARAMAPLLGFLRTAGVVPAGRPAPELRVEILRRYQTYLIQERGLTSAVRAHYVAVAVDLIEGIAAARDQPTVSADDVRVFVARLAQRPGPRTKLSALRSILRFLFLSGLTSVDLSCAVPSVPRWRLASLPRALGPAHVDAVLASCDRRTTVGRRNYAVLLLMVRLGLRAGEVAAVTLDDLDWRAGVVLIRGKGKTVSRLPLPVDVGQAIVAYLRRRRREVDSRAAFLQLRAPHRPVTAGTVTALAGLALRRAGVSGGAHRLRHTAATQMLSHGASLTEIAQVLRHRHIDTTAIYAKVDDRALQAVVRPWPAGGVAIGGTTLAALAQPWPGGGA